MARSLVTTLFAVTTANVVLATPSALNAQATGCEDAAVRISTSALPRVGAVQWNDWVTLTGCGTRGATIIAGALRSDGVRTETELTRLDHVAGLLDGWYQPALVSAYEWLLRSPDASNAVRLRAMWLLGGLYVPTVDVAGPLQGYMAGACESYERRTTLRDAPQWLPANEFDLARDAMAFAADDRSAPEYVRATARCWEAVVRDGARGDARDARNVHYDDRPDVVVQQRTIVVERPIRVVYECDNRFVLYNDAGYDLAVRYDGYGSPGVLRVTGGGPYVWVAARFGPVRFWVGDQPVYYSNVVYRPCGRTRAFYGASVSLWHGWHPGLGVYVTDHVFSGPRRTVYVVPRATRPIVIVRPRGSNPRDDHRNGRDDGRRDDGRRDDARRDDGRRDERGSGGQSHGTTPLPRAPEGQRQRFALPKGGGEPRAAPAAAPRSESGGGERSTPFKGKPDLRGSPGR